VLDIGSGDGRYLELLQPACNVYRLDYPATNTRYRRQPDVFGDAHRLPIADNSIDAVILLEVIEHVADDRRVIAETHRVLKPSGCIYVSAPFIYPEHDVPADFRRYTIYGLRKLLSDHGFRVTREQRHGNSFVVAFQLLNLSLLEAARDAHRSHRALGMIQGAFLYPICVVTNFIAWPFTLLKQNPASAFGYLITAVKE
jgi:SAM-dependent methyltransferase